MDKTIIDVLLTPLPVIHLLHIIKILCVTTSVVWIAARSRLAYCQKVEHTQRKTIREICDIFLRIWILYHDSFSPHDRLMISSVFILTGTNFCGKSFMKPWKIGKLHVLHWVCQLRSTVESASENLAVIVELRYMHIALYTFTLHTSYVQYIHNACRLEQHLFSQGVLVYHWLDVTWYKTSRFTKGWA